MYFMNKKTHKDERLAAIWIFEGLTHCRNLEEACPYVEKFIILYDLPCQEERHETILSQILKKNPKKTEKTDDKCLNKDKINEDESESINIEDDEMEDAKSNSMMKSSLYY